MKKYAKQISLLIFTIATPFAAASVIAERRAGAARAVVNHGWREHAGGLGGNLGWARA